MPMAASPVAHEPRVPKEPTEVQRATYRILHTVSDAQLGIRRVELVVEQARELFDNGFGNIDCRPSEEIEAILYSAAALLRELYAELDAADTKHRAEVE